MKQIILCRGIQGSGKTTYAKQWAEVDPTHRIRFNYDDIRNMLGKYWVPSREHILKRIRIAIISEAMESGYDIIVDNMNLNPKEVAWYEGVVKEFNERRGNTYHIVFLDFKTPVEECIKRDKSREHPVGEEIIRGTYERYKSFYESE